MTLKITPPDLQRLQAAVTPLDTPQARERYLAGNFPNASACTNRDMRYRWDLLWASKLHIGDGVGVQGDLNLYAYLDDTHIDSALRHLVPPLAVMAPAL